MGNSDVSLRRPKLTENDTDSHHQFCWITTNPVKKRMTHTATNCLWSRGESKYFHVLSFSHITTNVISTLPLFNWSALLIPLLYILHWPPLYPSARQKCCKKAKVYRSLTILSQNLLQPLFSCQPITLLWLHPEDTVWFDLTTELTFKPCFNFSPRLLKGMQSKCLLCTLSIIQGILYHSGQHHISRPPKLHDLSNNILLVNNLFKGDAVH